MNKPKQWSDHKHRQIRFLRLIMSDMELYASHRERKKRIQRAGFRKAFDVLQQRCLDRIVANIDSYKRRNDYWKGRI